MDRVTSRQFVIRGAVPSKSNCYRVVTLAGHGALAKTPALRRYEQEFYMQCPVRELKIDKRFRLDVDVYFSSDRPDLDNAMKAILDCLQTCKAISNDRLCAEIHARKLIDKQDPRCDITLTLLQ